MRLRLFVAAALLCPALMALAQQRPAPPKIDPAAQQAPAPSAPGTPETTSTELANAEAAMLRSDWKTAEPILNAWLAVHPDDARAFFDLGYSADAQNRNQDAALNYRKALEADPKSFEAQISLGLLLARTGETAEARSALEAATQLNPGNAGYIGKAKVWRALARIDLAGVDGKVDAAQAAIDLVEALKLSPETEDDTLMAATLAEKNNDPDAAEREYRKARRTYPDSTLAVAGLAHLLITQKKYPDAEELLKTALSKRPEDPALTAQLAAVLVAEDKAEALPLLQSIHAKRPEDSNLTRMLAQVTADAGEYTDSDKLYLDLLAADPKNPDLLCGHGQNLIRLRRYPEAVKVFQQATDLDETDGEAWNGLAFSSFETHQTQITLHALTARSKYLPENATIYFLWATAYDTLHDKSQAVAYYRRFLDSAEGKFPDQEWQAKQRLKLLQKGS